MSILDGLKKQAQVVAEKTEKVANVVGKRSEEMVEVVKLKMQKSEIYEQLKIKQIELSQLVYDAWEKGEMNLSDAAIKVCEDIKNCYLQIQEVRKKIEEVQQKEITCAKCGAKVASGNAFCEKCGNKIR